MGRKTFVLTSTLFTGFAMLAPTLASAQSTAAQDTSSPGAQPAAVKEVIVTGSRIRRPDLTSVQPVDLVTGQYLEDKGIRNIADGLNLIPSVGGSVTPAGAQGSFGTGRNYINLFNLGSQRTLTLVDGHRFVGSNAASQFTGASPGNQVDLNTLPTAFLDRIEVVPATGAAVYGTDAIAGVVNVIYKERFTGILIDGQDGLSSRGDYPTSHVTAAIGHDFLDHKANLAVDFEEDRTGSLAYTARPWTDAQYAFGANPNYVAGNGQSSQVLVSNRRVPEVTQGGLVFTKNTYLLNYLATEPNPSGAGKVPLQFAPNGNLVPYNTGTFYQPSIASGGQGLSLAPLTSLETPLDRKLVDAIGSYQFTPHLKLKASLFFADDDATAPANQPIYQSALFGGTSGNLPFSLNNPFLTPQAKAALMAAAPGQQTFYLARASTDIVGSSSVVSNTKAFDGTLNLVGDFHALDRDFNWNVMATRSLADGYFISPGINEANFLDAFNVTTNAQGQIVCASGNPACAPLDLFGQGAPSKAALAYITTPFRSDFTDEQTDVQGNFGGTLFQLPAGKWGFNLGFEYRRDTANFSPDANSRAGVGRSVAIPPAEGDDHSYEEYVETLLPIFGPSFNFPLLRKLELEGSFRKVDFSVHGDGEARSQENNAWSYGFRYSPIVDLTLRASRSNTYRSPSLTELFLSQSTSFTFATDPCDASNINSGPNPKTRAANCAADFAKLGATLTGFKSTIQSASQPALSGGNPDLKNETAQSWTYGFVYEPRYIHGLSLTADYVHIDLANAIVNFNATSILSTCYDSPSHPADVCSRITRDPGTGQILGSQSDPHVRAGYVNAGYFKFSGVTYSLAYQHRLGHLFSSPVDLGQFGVALNAFNTTRYQSSVSGTGYDEVNSADTIGYARWKYEANFKWTEGPLQVNWTTQFIEHSLYNRNYTYVTQPILSVGDYYEHDASFSYKTPWHVTVRGGVNNIFDQAPPFPNVGIGTYGQIGRYFWAGLSAKF